MKRIRAGFVAWAWLALALLSGCAASGRSYTAVSSELPSIKENGCRVVFYRTDSMVGAALQPAQATNGYFPHGFGLKAKGMGGTAVAQSHDAFGGVNNPASVSYAGNRWDLGAEVFMPRRSATVSTPMGAMEVKSGKDSFLIPELGFTTRLSSQMSATVPDSWTQAWKVSWDGALSSLRAIASVR